VPAFAPLDDELLFQVIQNDDSSISHVLWSTRGTADTTGPRVVLETTDVPLSLTSLGGSLAVFLAGSDGSSYERTQLWVTDGTGAGTRPLALPPGFLFSGDFSTTGDGRALFFRQAPKSSLWITDGTEAGTHEVRSFQDAPGGSGPRQQAALGGKLVFSAMVPDGTDPLFVSDGTAAGTGLLSRKATSAFSFFLFDGRLLFSAIRLHEYMPSLWVTDGTPAGTTRLSRYGFSNPALFDGRVLFSGTAGNPLEFGSELMKIDRQTRTARLVKDIDPFYFDENPASGERCLGESSSPVPGGILGGRLLLAADDGRSGRELWLSDGTAAGTVPLRDIHPGRIPEAPERCEYTPRGPHRHDTGMSSDPRDFVVLGKVALFSADDGRRGRELWITDGTSSGTRRLADLIRGPRGSAPHDLVRFQNRVYFLAGNPGQGESLWKTDGTARGTARVLDLTLDSLPSWGGSLTVAAGRLFFTVFNETTGAELWTSTGDADGTGMITDLNPGPASSSAQFLTAVGPTLLFTADDGLTGLEPWRTDGTAAGTLRLDDISPGRDASSPGPFTVFQDVVLTGADDGIHGRELWAIPRADIVQPAQ
jgi:ELWxxDGT repeat protein